MNQRIDIQIEARRWLETPYKHQHRALGVGVDCIGLIWAVGERCGVLSVDADQARPFLAYSRSPNPKKMGEALATFFVETATPLPGDFGWFAWDVDRAIPQHLAILAEHHKVGPTLIHADSTAGRCVEIGYTQEWPGMVRSWWRYPGVTDDYRNL